MAVVLFAGGVRAQNSAGNSGNPAATDTAPPAKTATELPGPQARLSFSGVVQLAADFSDAPGDVGVARGAADLSVVLTPDESSKVILGFGAERSWYSFTDATGFVGGSSEPWGNIMRADASILYSHEVDDEWGYYVGVNIASSGQDGATIGDTVTYGGLVGVMYTVNEDVRIGLGIGMRTVLEDDATIIPLPGVAWQIDEKWRLDTGAVRGGAGVVLTYKATKDLTAHLSVGYESRDFRLDDEASAPNGVGRDSRVPIALGVEWKVHPQVTLNADAGVGLMQEFTLDAEDGTRINQLDADMGLFVGIGVTIGF